MQWPNVPRAAGVIIQRALSDAGTAYLQHVRTDRTWGGEPEANAIATFHGFQTRIYENRGGNFALLSTIGAGPLRSLSLFWTGDHYVVANENPGGLNNQAYNAGRIVHDPVGDGNCMYEAIFYILRDGGNNIGATLRDDPVRRANEIRNMRTRAANNLDPALANVLGEELAEEEADDDFVFSRDVEWLKLAGWVSELYKLFPPKDHYLARDLKKGLCFYSRADKSRGESLDNTIKVNLKIADGKERERLSKYVARDRSYAAPDKPKKEEEEIEYPFPMMVPKVVYRWCTNAEARAALREGIIKVGGIHDGIPTMPNLIKKGFAEKGGGVGIVSADKCIEITTAGIPEIAKKQANSIRKTPAKGGVEWKIMVNIPAGAIRDCTKDAR